MRMPGVSLKQLQQLTENQEMHRAHKSSHVDLDQRFVRIEGEISGGVTKRWPAC